MKKFIVSLLLFLSIQIQAATTYQDYMTAYWDGGAPTSNDNSVIPNLMPFYYWVDTSDSNTGNIYISTSPSNTSIVWRMMITSLNLSDQLSALGWESNTLRPYSSQTLAFNTSRMPNANEDTLVIVGLQQTSTLILAATVNVQVDTGSGFGTIVSPSVSGVASTIVSSVSFIVPKGASYKIISASGSNSIPSLQELSM